MDNGAKRKMIGYGVAAMLGAGAMGLAGGWASVQFGLAGEATGAAVRSYILEHPEILPEAMERLGGLDALALNVGVGVGALGLAGATAEDWDQTLAINLRGPMLCCKEALPVMSEGGAIVFISSIAGLKPGSRLPAYDASKSALHALMRHVAREGAQKGVRANVVAPGLMDTPLGRAATQGRPSRGRTPTPLGRQGTGWETAYAALFLISDESAYVDGQILAVDGGLTTLS